MFCNDRFTRNTKKQSGIATSIIESFLITLYQFRTFPGAILCPFSPLSSSQRGHTPIRPVYISSVTKAICCNFPSRNTPSSYYQKSDLFFLSLVFFFLSPWCDLNIDNPSWNKYTHLHVFFFLLHPCNPLYPCRNGGQSSWKKHKGVRNTTTGLCMWKAKQEEFIADLLLQHKCGLAAELIPLWLHPLLPSLLLYSHLFNSFPPSSPECFVAFP